MNAINLYECYEHGEYSFTLRDRFIHSPQVERALTRLGDIHGDSRRTRASKGLLIQGPSGVGKSTLVKEYIRSLEELRAMTHRSGQFCSSRCLRLQPKEPGSSHFGRAEGSLRRGTRTFGRG